MVGTILNIDNQRLYIGWSLIRGYVEKDQIKKYQELYESSKENKLEDNTITYLTPLSEFPPYKLKNYIEENKLNIKTARKLDKINTLIINHDFITSSYLNRLTKYYIIPSEVILKNSYFNKYIQDTHWSHIHEKGGKSITHYFISKEGYKNLISKDSKFSVISEYPLTECRPISNDWGNKKAVDNIDFFLNIFDTIEKYNLQVIFDHNINDVVNEGLSIDEDVFENILGMITSKDDSNLELAKEIMANLEYTKSEPYFIYLFNYFHQLNKNSSNNKNYAYLSKQIKKHIHFKPTKHYPATFDQMIPTLINKHPKYIQDFMNCFRIHMNFIVKKNVIKGIETH